MLPKMMRVGLCPKSHQRWHICAPLFGIPFLFCFLLSPPTILNSQLCMHHRGDDDESVTQLFQSLIGLCYPLYWRYLLFCSCDTKLLRVPKEPSQLSRSPLCTFSVGPAALLGSPGLHTWTRSRAPLAAVSQWRRG